MACEDTDCFPDERSRLTSMIRTIVKVGKVKGPKPVKVRESRAAMASPAPTAIGLVWGDHDDSTKGILAAQAARRARGLRYDRNAQRMPS